ncbi:MAG: FapA family protein, partial [Mucispirillum sp.]|nr:FapA family protein [Mucispirillum sp.]
MDRITVRADKPQERARDICNKIYNLRPGEYEIEGGSEERATIIFKCPEKTMDSKVFLTTDDGAFTGFLFCYPSLNEGKTHTLEEINEYLQGEEIENLDGDQISAIFQRFADGEVIENEVIAEGVRPSPGKDAEITLHFGSADKKPKIKDGKVDFKNLDNIVMVEKGAVLITKKPVVKGSRGRNIKGEEVTPVPPKDIVILPGDGATVNEAGTIFSATTDGYVDFGNKRLGVYPVYNVKGDVDYSTGNIKFNGSVHVKGEVLSGFKIEADKHILVDGMCNDCELIAKGNVILRTGIKGTGAGFIKSGGSAIIGYAEKAKIYAKDSIEIRKYAFNCELFAGTKIDAMSGDGIIAGGVVRAFQDISAKQLGTNGNSKFNVVLGMKYYIEFELEKLRREKTRIHETMDRVDTALSRFNLKRPK